MPPAAGREENYGCRLPGCRFLDAGCHRVPGYSLAGCRWLLAGEGSVSPPVLFTGLLAAAHIAKNVRESVALGRPALDVYDHRQSAGEPAAITAKQLANEAIIPGSLQADEVGGTPIPCPLCGSLLSATKSASETHGVIMINSMGRLSGLHPRQSKIVWME